MNKEDVRQKMMDIVGDIYHAKFAEHGLNGYTKFDGHTWQEAKDTINTAFDRITIDHQKVKLPQEVGEELDDYQAEDIDLLDYLNDVIDSEELRVTRVWMLHDREHRIGILADAYRYGWEAEPESKWYVQTPKEWWEDKNKPEYVDLDSMGISGGLKCKEYAAQFTRAEIKQYHLDSDIFTLVPVEDEK